MEEIWKDIKRYDGYKVSNLGNILSLIKESPKVLKGTINKDGYRQHSLINFKTKKLETLTTHQLVAIGFLNHTPNGMNMVVNHINFNKLDNRVDNLEVITARENSNQKHLPSSSQYIGVSWLKSSSQWMSTISINGKQNYLGLFDCELAAAKAYQDKLKDII